MFFTQKKIPYGFYKEQILLCMQFNLTIKKY